VVRARDIALTALALRTSHTRPPKSERRLVPAVDEPNAAKLDRDALNMSRAALIASLWPRPGLCALPADYPQLGAPALFGMMFAVTWHPPAEPEHVFPRAEGELQVDYAWAA
jgi:hypothetical protein